ncbi:beta-ketoacyl synthase N-terminal-like domain-containing protein [Streptosporangium roseum]|uniref:beta-ketoacyl synthase N-terminal-like domain-containing protein n=1 Tax=Streptosporangium roseum TaxID=2001 RepID=UPI0033247C00
MTLLAEGKITADEASELLADQQIRPENGAIAALGAAVRMPGASDLDELWRRLSEAKSLIGPFPAQRFDLITGAREELADQHGHHREHLGSDSRSFGGWLRDIEQFDHDAFGLSAFEAEFMGPAERLLLQVTEEAITLSGLKSADLRGTRTGVFGAYQPNASFEYLQLFDDPDERAFVSNIPANAFYRIAYTHDLRGPVMSVDTTCSSSLVALHLARRALQAGECDLAIVASVSLSLFPFWGGESDYFVKSPHHRCAAYDAAADGVAWGEGIVAVVLKRAEDAVRDRDYVSALVTGSAVSSDGASNGMPVPNPEAHQDVVRAALAEGRVSASDIGYVEGHGAGTALGDVIEVDALSRAFRADTAETGYCRLGSIKAVMGHLGDTAGLAGFVEAMLCLRQRRFPGLAGLSRPNPAIDWARTPFVVSAEESPWTDPPNGAPRRAGVSSLGISGTNVHVILEEPGSVEPTRPTSAMTPVFVSARTRWALWELIRRLAEGIDEGAAVHDIAYTLARRGIGPARLGIFAADTADLLHKLGQLLPVREFDRIPDHLGSQYVFLSDTPEAGEQSLSELSDNIGDRVTPGDVALMTRYLKHVEADGECVGRLEPGRVLPLALAPMTTRRVWPAVTERSVDVSSLFFRPAWVPVKAAVAGAATGGTWVVFARPADPVAEAVVRRLRAGGSRAVLATAASGFTRFGPDHFGLTLDNVEDYGMLWRSIGPLSEFAGVVHLLGYGSAEHPMASARALHDSQRDGVFSLFHLAQSMIQLSLEQPMVLAVVVSLAESVVEGEDYAPPRVTGFGFAKVLSQEVPHLSEIAIDHDLSCSPAEAADQIVAEIDADPRGRLPLVAYRAGRRYTKHVNRAVEGGGTALTIREGGTYVIAGGTGYLGMQVGTFLAEHGAGSIVLLSRNGLPEGPNLADKAEAIRRMEECGASVRVLRCDVTRESDVARAFAEIRDERGRIDGAFMLAKELFHLWIGELDFPRFRRGIENRVLGTWLLAEQLRQDEPDFLVLFSSISSLSGTKGAAECAAVNQYLDALAPHLTRGGIPTYTLNLPLILDDRSDFAARTPIPPIDFAEFRAALERFFRDAHAVDIVARLDLDEVHYLRDVLRIPFGPEVWEEAAQGNAGPEAVHDDAVEWDEDLIRDLLAQAWRTTLGRFAADAAENFFAAGGTSLSAVRLVHLVGKSMPGAAFDVAALYGNPTFAAQVAYCARYLQPIPEVDDDLASILARVESGELSESEAVARLSGIPGGLL